MSQIDDMEAINNYMHKTKAITSDAQKLQTKWFSWYDKLGYFDKHFADSAYAEARARRNDFNVANAVTTADKQAVEQVISTGMTTEEMQATPVETSKRTASVNKRYHDVSGLPIQKGSRGDIVKSWQRIVAAYPVDGKFGKDTEKLTKQWQKNHGFEPNGIVDTNVFNAAVQVTKQAPVEPLPAKIPEQAKIAQKRAVVAKKEAEKFSPKPASKVTTAITKTTEKVKTTEAGMLSAISNLPTPVKVIGGGIAVGAALYYGNKYHEKGHF